MPDLSIVYSNTGAIRWGADAVANIKWDPANHVGEASVIDETTGTVYEIGEGGGGGDLKIFNVTVQGHKNGTGNEFPVLESSTFIVYYPDPERPEIYETQSLQIESEPQTFSLVTAIDSIQASLNISDGVINSVETTGNVTYLQEYYSVIITGDCTIDVTFTTGG